MQVDRTTVRTPSSWLRQIYHRRSEWADLSGYTCTSAFLCESASIVPAFWTNAETHQKRFVLDTSFLCVTLVEQKSTTLEKCATTVVLFVHLLFHNRSQLVACLRQQPSTECFNVEWTYFHQHADQDPFRIERDYTYIDVWMQMA